MSQREKKEKRKKKDRKKGSCWKEGREEERKKRMYSPIRNVVQWFNLYIRSADGEIETLVITSTSILRRSRY
jgi:hypothetical protein